MGLGLAAAAPQPARLHLRSPRQVMLDDDLVRGRARVWVEGRGWVCVRGRVRVIAFRLGMLLGLGLGLELVLGLRFG